MGSVTHLRNFTRLHDLAAQAPDLQVGKKLFFSSSMDRFQQIWNRVAEVLEKWAEKRWRAAPTSP